jgi:hypothetical protein
MNVVKVYTNEQINENIRKALCDSIARRIFDSVDFQQSVIHIKSSDKEQDVLQEAV